MPRLVIDEFLLWAVSTMTYFISFGIMIVVFVVVILVLRRQRSRYHIRLGQRGHMRHVRFRLKI